MKINKKQFRKWITALRSGEYKQTKHRLQDNNGFCCLGVACQILIPENKKRKNEFGHLAGEVAGTQPNAPRWLKQMDEGADVGDSFSSLTGNNESIPSLNDDMDLNFNEIADVLEAVYIHKVLD